MRSFRDMNPTRVGLISIALVVVAVIALFNITTFPQLLGASRYTAEFASAAGLQEGDKVRVNGVPVGDVHSLELAGDRVVVTFDVTRSDTEFGDKSTLEIKTDTLLGRKYLAITPRGDRPADTGETISLARTEVPYDLTDQLGELAKRAESIDVKKLSQSLDAVSQALDDSPEEMRPALRGLHRLSTTISSRDKQIRELLKRAESVTGVLADRNKTLTRLFNDGNSLLSELQSRRAAIQRLFVTVSALADELSGVVQDNQRQLKPALKQLNSVLAMLRKNEGNLVSILRQFGPYATRLGSAISSGPFWDAYIQNLIPGNLIPLPTLPGSEAAKASSGGN